MPRPPFEPNQYFFQSTPRKNIEPLDRNQIFREAYRLDRLSCEGINCLLPFVKTLSSVEFEMVVDRLLKKCFYINRTFSDTVKFLSIWLRKSPHTLVARLKKNDLKEFFCRIEYDKDGCEWPFPKLLHIFLPIMGEALKPRHVIDYLFNTFCFFSMPQTFIWQVIGYDQLNLRLAQIDNVFHGPLLEKMSYFYCIGEDLGPHSAERFQLYKSKRKLFLEQNNSLLVIEKFFDSVEEEPDRQAPLITFTNA